MMILYQVFIFIVFLCLLFKCTGIYYLICLVFIWICFSTIPLKIFKGAKADKTKKSYQDKYYEEYGELP